MRECRGYTRYESRVVDDGWNPPVEVLEEITLKIAAAKNAALRLVQREKKLHKGMWIDKGIASKYAAKSWIYRELSGNQYCGKVREMGEELMELYGLTELEAINILFERNVQDCLNKYYRIKNLIPAKVNEERIRDDVMEEYFEGAI